MHPAYNQIKPVRLRSKKECTITKAYNPGLQEAEKQAGQSSLYTGAQTQTKKL